MELVVLIGVQGAGKSSFYRSRYAGTHVHVSKDLLGRSARNKDEKQMRLVDTALQSGRPVVVDNTNPRRADRAPLIELAHRLGAKATGILVAAPVADCLRRNAAREGKARVPDVAIFVTVRKLEPPSREEGFDEVLEARLEDDGSWAVGPLAAAPQT
jgi:predicted kinase